MSELDQHKYFINSGSKVLSIEKSIDQEKPVSKGRVYIRGTGFCPIISIIDNDYIVLLPDMTTIRMSIEKLF